MVCQVGLIELHLLTNCQYAPSNQGYSQLVGGSGAATTRILRQISQRWVLALACSNHGLTRHLEALRDPPYQNCCLTYLSRRLLFRQTDESKFNKQCSPTGISTAVPGQPSRDYSVQTDGQCHNYGESCRIMETRCYFPSPFFYGNQPAAVAVAAASAATQQRRVSK
jgi:hypothetical protein